MDLNEVVMIYKNKNNHNKHSNNLNQKPISLEEYKPKMIQNY